MDVSIIIPTYNRLWCLPAAIMSCSNTKCKVEIIVIDDGSTDGTWEWLEQQSGIIKIKQPNWGKCWAVNKGFELATGKYVRFLDSDDLLNTNAIDEQFELAESQQFDVVVSGYTVIDENNQVLRSQTWIHCDDFIAQQLGECDSSHYSAYLFRKDFISTIPHRPDFAFRDDRLFVLEVALKNPKVGIHEGLALAHRVHQGERLQFPSATNQIVQHNQHLKIYQKILNQLAEAHKLDQRKIDASIRILWPLAHWIAKYDLNEANQVVKWLYQLKPNFSIPETGALRKLYQLLGFKKTEQLLKARRLLVGKLKS